jgi:hypothetical protein
MPSWSRPPAMRSAAPASSAMYRGFSYFALPKRTETPVSMYPEGTPVLVKYPRNEAEKDGDRSEWPWLPGTVEETCGPDEWLIVVEDRAVAQLEDGSPAPADVADDDVFFPMCFRDSSEIRAAR